MKISHLLLSFLLIGLVAQPAGSAEIPDSLDELAEAIRDRASRMNNISANVESIEVIQGEDGEFLRNDAISSEYKEDVESGRRWVSRTETVRNEAGGVLRTVESSTSSFDGERTFKLEHIRGDKGYNRGWILPGEFDGAMPDDQERPSTLIWSWMGQGDSVEKLFVEPSLEFDLKQDQGKIIVKMVSKKNPDFWSRLVIDPSKGFLPVVQESYFNGNTLMSRLVMKDVGEAAEGVFYPSRIEVDRGEGTPTTRSVDISNFSLEPIAADDFNISFPNGTRVVDQIVDTAYFAGASSTLEEGVANVDEAAVGRRLSADIVEADRQFEARGGFVDDPPQDITGGGYIDTDQDLRENPSYILIGSVLVFAVISGGIFVYSLLRRKSHRASSVILLCVLILQSLSSFGEESSSTSSLESYIYESTGCAAVATFVALQVTEFAGAWTPSRNQPQNARH